MGFLLLLWIHFYTCSNIRVASNLLWKKYCFLFQYYFHPCRIFNYKLFFF